MGKRQADVNNARHRDAHIRNRHISTQDHGCKEREHGRCHQRHQDHIQLSEIGTVEHAANAEKSRKERGTAAAIGKGTRELKPRKYGKHRRCYDERGAPLLDHVGSKDNADCSGNNTCNQRQPPIYPSDRPPNRRFRPVKSSIAAASSSGVKSGQFVSVK